MAKRSSRRASARMGRLSRPSLHQHPRALAQRDPRRWPARNRCPVGRFRDLEIIDASDVLEDTGRGASAAAQGRKTPPTGPILAAKNKSLALSNKSRTGVEATKRRNRQMNGYPVRA
jgi:hypothetical protein